MTECCATPDRSDLTGRKVARLVLWQLPLMVFVAGVFVGPLWRTMLWTGALTVAGTACVANAARCGRLHCYFTGPFYLPGASITLIYGLGILPLGPGRWGWIGLAVAAGSRVFAYVPEWIGGKYITRARPAGG